MLGYLPEKKIRGSFPVLEESVLFLCKMATKTRSRNEKTVNESDTDTTVAKKGDTDTTVANKAATDAIAANKGGQDEPVENDEAARSVKGAAELTQPSGYEEMSSISAPKCTLDDEENDRSRDYNSVVHNYRWLLFPCLAVVILFMAIMLRPSQPSPTSDFDYVKTFENKLRSLQSVLTNQTDRFWKILKSRGLSHLRKLSPQQPLVLLLASPPPAHDVTNCLAEKLGEALDPKHKKKLVQVDGAEVKGNPGEKVKKSMDDLLKEKFQQGHRVAVIKHLELFPTLSLFLFHSYCDDQNAPHKHVAIIFTVYLPNEPDLSLPPKEAEGMVEKYLSNDVWAKENQDSVADLLSLIADTVALMNGESGEYAKTLCS